MAPLIGLNSTFSYNGVIRDFVTNPQYATDSTSGNYSASQIGYLLASNPLDASDPSQGIDLITRTYNENQEKINNFRLWLQKEKEHLNKMWEMYNGKIPEVEQMYINNKPDPNLTSGDIFDKALKITLNFEGGYANDKDDPGGKTNCGVTWGTYQSWLEGNGNKWRQQHGLGYIDPKDSKNSIKHITPAEVREIYNKEYWIASGADRVSDPKMAIALFDTAVLNGVGTAQKLFTDSGGDLKTMQGCDLKTFLEKRQQKYDEIIAKHPKLAKYRKNWRGRVVELAQKLGLSPKTVTA